MDMKVSVFIGISLDGFIARQDGDLDWLHANDGTDGEQFGEEDYGYQEHWNKIDTLVLGRHSFETVLGFNQWPYEGKRVVVLSSGQPTIPDSLADKVEILSGPVEEVARSLYDSGSRHLYVDGGQVVQSFLRAGLVTDMVITVAPVLIGEGISLFGPLEEDIRLELQECRGYPAGYAQLRYKAQK